ncbi:MAG: hypothetical protein FJZ90_08715 [Chloroflexi bacterium]|nr:hypothetical protein [Chloroflexota bacterium]
MEFDTLLEVVGDEPVFETGLLLAGDVDPRYVRMQLSRWVASGRVLRLRRGLYALAPPYRKIRPHPFVVANRLLPGSYVSLQSALAHYGLIPEYVPVTTSVSARRTARWGTPLGAYLFRTMKLELLWGYASLDLGASQRAFVALPEKALLDLVYLEPEAAELAYLHELRLQGLECLDLDTLRGMAVRAASPKLLRAAERIAGLAAEEAEYEAL